MQEISNLVLFMNFLVMGTFLLTLYVLHSLQGILDIMLTSLSKDGQPRMHVFEHKFVDDACFIKVKGKWTLYHNFISSTARSA